MKHRIKELITEKGYTQQQFADKLGMNRVSLNHIINGKPSFPTLEKVSEALNVEIWELFVTKEEIMAKSHGEIVCPSCGQRFDLKN